MCCAGGTVGSGDIVNFRDSETKDGLEDSFDACSGRVSGKTSPQWPSQSRSQLLPYGESCDRDVDVEMEGGKEVD